MNLDKPNEIQIKKSITLKDIFTVVWSNKILLIITTLIGLVLSVVAGVVLNSTSSKVSTIVEFQWSGINSGEYPNGVRFDYTNIFESYIFADAISELDIQDVSTGDLRSSIKVSPIIPSNVYQMIEAELLKGNQITYYPNVFSISIGYSNLGLSIKESQELLSLLIDKYRTDFENKYIQRSIIIDYTNVDIENYDYKEAYKIFLSQLELINNAVDKSSILGGEFVSTKLGIGFSDISVRADLIESIALSSLSARINNYLLSKDNTLMVTRYRYEVEMIELDLAKYLQIETGLEDLIANYTGSTSVIIIPGLDMTDIETNSYINTLYDNLVDIKTKISNAENDIAYNNIRIDRISGNDPTFIVTPEQVVTETAIVISLIESTNQTISEIVEDLDVILKEYNQYIVRATINPIMVPQYIAHYDIITFALVGMVAGGSIGLAYIFINYQKKEND